MHSTHATMCCEKERVEERIICILAAGSKVRSLPSLISASGVNRKATCQISGPRYPTLFFTLCYFLFRRLGFSYFRNASSWLLLDMGFSIHSIDSWNEVVFLFFLFIRIRSSVQSSTFSPSTHRQDVGRKRKDWWTPPQQLDLYWFHRHAVTIMQPGWWGDRAAWGGCWYALLAFFIWNKSTNIDELHFLSGELINSSFFFLFSSMKMFSFFFSWLENVGRQHTDTTQYVVK